MLKLRYDATTGLVGNAFPDSVDVPEPFLRITEGQNDTIKNDSENLYFVEDGVIVAKPKMPIVQEEAFNDQFIKTSIGYLRKETSEGDILNRMNSYEIIARVNQGLAKEVLLLYKEPDFTQELSDEYIKSLQFWNESMTYEQFLTLFSEVTTAYITKFKG